MGSSVKTKTISRKSDHLRLALSEKSISSEKTLLSCVKIFNCSVPDMSFSEISSTASIAGKRVSAPIMVSPMSGGTNVAERLNIAVAEACESLNLPFGVGSQRVLLESPATKRTFNVRKFAKNSPIFANLGISCFTSGGLSPKVARDAVDSIEADALFIHLNPAQEVVQVEGDRNFSRSFEILEEICDSAGVPVFAREVGFGLSPSVARKLVDCGVSGLDVSGAGGTDFVKIELMRGGDSLGKSLSDWGIPTGASVALCSKLGVPVIASGGLKTGVDVARAIALGAWGGGFARDVLLAHSKGGKKSVENFLKERISELKASMFLSGSRDLQALANVEKAVLGELSQWLQNSKA